MPSTPARPGFLISPTMHRPWTLALQWSMGIVLPIVLIALVVVYAANGENLWVIVFRPVGITLTVAMYLFGGITGVCALVDRTREDDRARR